MVSEATELSLGYIDAVLGHGKEQYGLNVSFLLVYVFRLFKSIKFDTNAILVSNESSF